MHRQFGATTRELPSGVSNQRMMFSFLGRLAPDQFPFSERIFKDLIHLNESRRSFDPLIPVHLRANVIAALGFSRPRMTL